LAYYNTPKPSLFFLFDAQEIHDLSPSAGNPVSLKTIFNDFPLKYSPHDLPDIPVTNIVMDSRKVKAGDLFVAMQGGLVDGHAFIPAAVREGASAVVGEKTITGLKLPYIRVENSRRALSWLSAAYYGYPARKLTVIGVTGTDGKTTTCNLVHKILQSAGCKAGLISTVNAVIGDSVIDTGFHVTTPDAPDIQRYLADMVSAGMTHVVLETTSHGLAQYRVDACEFDVGVVTNITHEHLDQHGSYENYRAVKLRLFQSLVETLPKPQGNPRLSVLNHDDSSYEYLQEQISTRQLSYGIDQLADVWADSLNCSVGGNQFQVVSKDFRVPVSSKLIGRYNISNCLAAVTAVVYGLGIKPEIVARGVAAMEAVPGRMEQIDLGQPFTALVDFAHTPNALRVAIETIKSISSGKRVIVIFGSAGLRDREKRRMMAETAQDLADLSVLTAEDPRTESLDTILEEMAAGARAKGGLEGQNFWRVPDRGEAIRFGLQLAKPGDVVVACGKGHEQSMCFGRIEYPWDDRQAMRAALSELMGVSGPKMPHLPTSDKE
jgi:UDP-N-acetylmuramoyl-L-alanyl-D-glutamate--2,6-diaminopimelate ligase